ncbi:hypothetical protein A2707_04690 [Candidatus Saccharibacteria bacterium RIFCSPHIGHO2_01_FULL_45_15]|nr:MAG: hypothetical protein A2707_04690 [Candidatus Saccharibacteria bacterium RIFCSPHIGHO2_01_FULL_45_15]OGL27538.1 MAG: hypothetical protein A3C39_03195 [Candidatus Saccharibacteria bacterium RIFCSPHIGHO2_02_FULL_46_12]OGL32729.1 MAG: hypothetical protein A3E76_05270 [Candidatus Saccharibacteria bacterium RIFCSPHIGHO2_12_FULL_44_22]
MHQNDPQNQPANFSDDTRVLRYLLHTVKGISPVSGGVMGDALEQEYETAEAEVTIDQQYAA